MGTYRFLRLLPIVDEVDDTNGHRSSRSQGYLGSSRHDSVDH